MIGMENIETVVKSSVQILVMSVNCGVVVSYFVISNGIGELVAFVPTIQFFVPMIVSDSGGFSEGI